MYVQGFDVTSFAQCGDAHHRRYARDWNTIKAADLSPPAPDGLGLKLNLFAYNLCAIISSHIELVKGAQG
jgi:hypothetical protein